MSSGNCAMSASGRSSAARAASRGIDVCREVLEADHVARGRRRRRPARRRARGRAGRSSCHRAGSGTARPCACRCGRWSSASRRSRSRRRSSASQRKSHGVSPGQAASALLIGRVMSIQLIVGPLARVRLVKCFGNSERISCAHCTPTANRYFTGTIGRGRVGRLARPFREDCRDLTDESSRVCKSGAEAGRGHYDRIAAQRERHKSRPASLIARGRDRAARTLRERGHRPHKGVVGA